MGRPQTARESDSQVLMPPTNPRLVQTLIDGGEESDSVQMIKLHERDLTRDILGVFNHGQALGISPGYSKSGSLTALAVTDQKYCIIVQFYSNRLDSGKAKGKGRDQPNLQNRDLRGRRLLEELVLCRDTGQLYAFDFGPLSMSLFCDTDLRVTNGVDIQSGFSAIDRKPLSAIKDALGDFMRVHDVNVRSVFMNPVYLEDDRYRDRDLAQRAWISQFLANFGNGAETFDKVRRIDTKKLSLEAIQIIAKMTSDSLRLDQMKPIMKKHDFTTISDADGQTGLESVFYKNKIRPDQAVLMNVQNSHGSYNVRGQTGGVHGRIASINTEHSLQEKTILKVTTIGRDDPTTAEAQRAATVLRILQGNLGLLSDNAWIQNIWLPSSDHPDLLVWPEAWSSSSVLPVSRAPTSNSQNPSDSKSRISLNKSQMLAVDTMLSSADTNRIVLIQGPPGTGKTSVIAAFVQQAISSGQSGIWLVAQSNVAVKNIAEKLASIGFLDWRLLVSKDFQFQWHEHIYTKVQANVIRSDRFSKLPLKELQGCQVILCTLSMLSNFLINNFTRHIPLRTVLVDEASQIEIGDYLQVFTKFHKTLRKMCFIGDDKQLPPYGQEDLQDLQSIFEVTHLRRLTLFLDTQYRMPPQLGEFISPAVYDGKLNSNPKHPITNDIIACRFIDVPGKEYQGTGSSWMNKLECDAVILLAQHLQDQNKSYKIITPYEAQRSAIETEMQNTPNLEWGDKCFNVDSFQGNEEDYIIISLVRSRQLGFLINLRRTNVMLTRCKKGMFIISSRAFLGGVGAQSLVGELAEQVAEEGWLQVQDIKDGKFWEARRSLVD